MDIALTLGGAALFGVGVMGLFWAVLGRKL